MENIRVAYPEAVRGKQNERGTAFRTFMDDTKNVGKVERFKKEKR